MHNDAAYSAAGRPVDTDRPDPSFVQSLRVQVSMWDLDPSRSVATSEVLARRYLAAVDAQAPVQHGNVPRLFGNLTPSWGWREDGASFGFALLLALCTGTAVYSLLSNVFGGASAAIVAVLLAGIVGGTAPIILRRTVLLASRARADAAAQRLDAELPRTEAFGGR